MMGMYDTFGEEYEQLKVGACLLHHYQVGQVVDLPNGIYYGYSRAIVVTGRIFVADIPLNQVYDKWGSQMQIDINGRNPIKHELDRLQERLQKEGEGENLVDRNDENAGQSTKET